MSYLVLHFQAFWHRKLNYQSQLKFLEGIITKKLTKLLSNYISPCLHGFIPKYSISTNLLTYQTYPLQSYDNNIGLIQCITISKNLSLELNSFKQLNMGLNIMKILPCIK